MAQGNVLAMPRTVSPRQESWESLLSLDAFLKKKFINVQIYNFQFNRRGFPLSCVVALLSPVWPQEHLLDQSRVWSRYTSWDTCVSPPYNTVLFLNRSLISSL